MPRGTGSSLRVNTAAESELSAGSHAMRAIQAPPLTAFLRKTKMAYINFRDWHEQLELVAGLCGWSDHVRLVNVATRLKRVVYSSIVPALPPRGSSITRR